MKKRILSILLILAMAFSLLPAAAMAAPAYEATWGTSADSQPNSGTIGQAIEAVNAGTATYVTVVKNIKSGAISITASAPVVISTDKTVSLTDSFYVSADADVRLTGGGKIVRGSGFTVNNLFRVLGDLTLDAITVSGGSVSTYYRTVYVGDGATLTINEGAVLSDALNTNGDGSVLYVYGGTVVMNGGVIENNTVRSYGNIHLDKDAEFTMNGGVIRNNTLTNSGTYGGGAVYVREAVFTMNGGTISGHTGVPSYGGAIYCTSYGKVFLNGGVIDNNTSERGDAVFYSSRQGSGSELYIGGNPLITNSIYLDSTNSAKYPYITSSIKQPLILEVNEFTEGRIIAQGASGYILTEADMAKVSLYVHDDATKYYAKLDSTNNRLLMTATDPGYVEKYYVSYHGNGGTGETLDNTAYEAGTTAAVKANGFEKAGSTFIGWNTKADGTGIAYAPGSTAAMGADLVLYAQWADSHMHPICGTSCGCAANHADVEWIKIDEASDFTSLEDGKHYYLATDITVSDTISITENVALCLNGKVLKKSGAGRVLFISGGGILTLTDCTAVAHKFSVNQSGLWVLDEENGTKTVTGGVITGGSVTGRSEFGGAIAIGNGGGHAGTGTLNMYAGNLVGNSADVNGGAVCVANADTAVFNLWGGAICGNVGGYGAGVNTWGVFHMFGGSISGNTAYAPLDSGKGSGAGVYVANGTTTISGGSVTNNTATDYAAGINFVGGTLTLSGSLDVSGNKTKAGKDANVFIAKNKTITAESVTVNAPIGVSSGSTADKIAVTGANSADISAKFTSELDGYEIGNDTNNVVVLQKVASSFEVVFRDHDGATLKTETVSAGGAATAPADPTREGYTFTGWDTAFDNVTAALTVTAQYRINQYTVTFNTDGGTAIAPITQDYGTAVTAPAAPTKTGYTFAGWNKAIPATMPAENVTVTATWTINQYTITFNTDGGTAIAPITQDYGTAVTKPANPTKTGYDFGGWYADAAKTTAYVFGTVPAENITVYAKWTPADGIAYTVNHMLENVSCDGYTLADSETLRGTTNASTAAAAKTYPGFTAQAITQTTILADGSAVVEIKYDRNTYKVTLVANGGTVKAGDVTEYTYGVGAALPTVVDKVGYIFRGWYDNAACTGTPVTQIPTTAMGEKTFYAKWDFNMAPFAPLFTLYDIRVSDGITGGAVRTDRALAVSNSAVTVTLLPLEGYTVQAVTVTDAAGNAVALTKISDGEYTFRMPARDVTVTAVFAQTDALGACPRDASCPMAAYPDLNRNEWYHDGVHFCIENSLMKGYSDGTFQPDTAATRAVIVAALWQLEGKPVVNYAMTFEDVAQDAWYAEAVRWAASVGVVEGYSDEAFGPEDSITREQLAAILYRYEQHRGGGFKGSWMFRMDYTDLADVSDWAYEAMCWCTMNPIIEGKPGKLLDPKGTAARAQAAAMLHRYCEVLTKEA